MKYDTPVKIFSSDGVTVRLLSLKVAGVNDATISGSGFGSEILGVICDPDTFASIANTVKCYTGAEIVPNPATQLVSLTGYVYPSSSV